MFVTTRRAKVMIAATCAIAVSACATLARGGAGASYPLVVNNRSDFEVVVYAMPSSTGAGIRIGNARSFTTTTMSVPRNALQSADRLVLKLHSIGSNAAPTITPATNVDSSVVVELDIRADASGSLSRSMLYTDVAAAGRHPY